MDPLPAELISYCGAPPSPDQLAGRWNLDPVLMAALGALLALYLLGALRRQATAQQRSLFVAGWAVGALALVSPLCPLSVSLFSARVGQHMILVLVSAPLVALGRPLAAYAGLARAPRPRADTSLAAAIVFMAMLWLWHAPRPYTATFLSTPIYWTMHITVIGSAIWLWAEILNPAPTLARAAAAGVSMLQMGLLGALITLSERPLYPPHQLTTAAWRLTPLQDQQLGGVIMWVPGGLLFLVVAGWMVRRLLAPALTQGARPGAPTRDSGGVIAVRTSP